MPGYTPNGKKVMLEAVAPDHVSLHSEDPGTSGEHELSGGGYERKAIEWNAPSTGSMGEKSGEIGISVPAGAKVKFVGFWKSTTLVSSAEVTEEAFTNAGVYTLTAATLDLNK